VGLFLFPGHHTGNPEVLVKGKGKGVPVIFSFTEHHAMKAYWGMEVYLHAFFDLGTRWR
jgi:hypothetical protein